jgi:sugar/nucleoside kinase (ribokinase family)
VSFGKKSKYVSAPAASDYVLIVGAAHIDVLADYTASDAAKIDKVGHVRYSVGGTGYNLAINLAQSGVPVSLLTVLREHSFSSIWIRERLEAAGVRSDRIQLSDHIAESGFVGIRCDGQLNTAVTATAVGEYAFRLDLIEEAVLQARLVAIDCNLAVDQIALLAECAKRHNRPIAVAGVSDSKIVRLLQLSDHKAFDIVVINENEAQTVLAHKSHHKINEICTRLRAEQVIITEGANGYRVISKTTPPKHYEAPQVEKIVSRTGAGDALFAGVLGYWYQNQRLDFDDAVPTIAISIRKVLQQPGATVGSLATDVDFGLLARIAVRNEPLWKRILSPEIGVAAAIIVTILTVGLIILTYELLPPRSPAATGSSTTSGQTAIPKEATVKTAPAAPQSSETKPKHSK